MKELLTLLRSNEEWLMQRILNYSHRQGYVKYTSTLKEAWRISIQGLSDAICGTIESGNEIELTPDEDFSCDPAAQFGIIEAKKHRERGISYSMFMGLFKYYRECYSDLMKEQSYSIEDKFRYILFMGRIFDRIEIGFSSKWAELSGEEKLDELKNANRVMTNEKNMYLTVVESLSSPVFFLNSSGIIVYINRAASKLLRLSHTPGSFYYNRDDLRINLPQWITCYSDTFNNERPNELCFEAIDPDNPDSKSYQGRIASMEDVSGKYSGSVIILSDITDRIEAENKIRSQNNELEHALSDIKRLRGILPICAGCKKIRNDEGYWDQVEIYISEHSDAEFSHGLCPDCVQKLYPDLKIEKTF